MNKTIQTISDLSTQPDIKTYLEFSTAGNNPIIIEFNFTQNQWEVSFDEGDKYFDSESDAVHFALEMLRS